MGSPDIPAVYDSLSIRVEDNTEYEERLMLLRKKDKTSDETERLKYLNRKMSFSPQFIRLLEAHDKKDPNVKFISMNQGGVIQHSPNNESKNIFTYGLNGCTATVVSVKLKNGDKKIILTHFPPTNKRRNMDMLSSLIKQHVNVSEVSSLEYLIVTPEQYKRNKSGGYDMGHDEEFIKYLVTSIKSNLGDNINGKVSRYSTNKRLGEKNQGGLRISIDHEKITYQQGTYGFGILHSDD